jgi:hypothetical protein
MKERSFYSGYFMRSILLVSIPVLLSCNSTQEKRDNNPVTDSIHRNEANAEVYYTIADTSLLGQQLSIDMRSDGLWITYITGSDSIQKKIEQPVTKGGNTGAIKSVVNNKVVASDFVLLDDSTFAFTAFEQEDRGILRIHALRYAGNDLIPVVLPFAGFSDYVILNQGKKLWLTHSPTPVPDEKDKPSYNFNIYKYDNGKMNLVREELIYEKDLLFNKMDEYSDEAIIEMYHRYIK